MMFRIDRRLHLRLICLQVVLGTIVVASIYNLLFHFSESDTFISKNGKYFAYYRDFDGNISPDVFPLNDEDERDMSMHLVVVACGGKLKPAYQEAVTMIKSAVLFSRSTLVIHIFTDQLRQQFESEISSWPSTVLQKVKILFHDVDYPLPAKDVEELKEWWAPCASLRLFLPNILSGLDSVIYVDCDVVFLSAVDDLWQYFSSFSRTNVGALAPRVGWQFKVPDANTHFISKPDGSKTQVNSGVFLMNLTRMREAKLSTDPRISEEQYSWSKELLLPLYYKYKSEMYGDQDLINILFHFNSERIYFLPCKFNYHHKFCFDKFEQRWCDSAEQDGASVIHGTAKTFHNNYAPAFKAVYEAMRNYKFETNIRKSLMEIAMTKLNTKSVLAHEHCGNKTELFVKQLEKSILNMK